MYHICHCTDRSTARSLMIFILVEVVICSWRVNHVLHAHCQCLDYRRPTSKTTFKTISYYFLHMHHISRAKTPMAPAPTVKRCLSSIRTKIVFAPFSPDNMSSSARLHNVRAFGCLFTSASFTQRGSLWTFPVLEARSRLTCGLNIHSVA